MVQVTDHESLPFMHSFPPLPSLYANTLLDVIETIFPGVVEECDSSQESHRSQVMHCTFYNRCATRVSFFFKKGLSVLNFLQGTDIPDISDIWMSTKNDGTSIDPTQCLPRMASEADERYYALQKAMSHIFEWLTQQVYSELIPRIIVSFIP